MKRLNAWIEEIVDLCHPDGVYHCDGSKEEYHRFTEELVRQGTFIPLKKRENSFWCHSTEDDVARLEEATFICSSSPDESGPTNHWREPGEMKRFLKELFRGCMRGRLLYVIPFCMGPLTSPFSRFGIQLTDSLYVASSMHLMTRMGTEVLEHLGDGRFVPCLHSVGAPLEKGEKGASWPCSHSQKYIVHFPDDPSVWSFGSGYGGNALLSKKCFALRIASVMGRKEGWLAEHMLILGITNPQGEKKYFVAAFPSSCGKTNLAMINSPIEGWKIECVGDDIAWLSYGSDGKLYAINPESGFFGVAPGTSMKSNPHAFTTIQKNTIFTNVALTAEGDVWWEGMSASPPPNLTDWQGRPWDPSKGSPAAHPNSRFTVSASQCPVLDPAAGDPRGVPISAILFGGRRESVIPLVAEALNWEHGVFMGASMSSETTAAAKGIVGHLRHDPFAMLPFCGYHMGDYFTHWLEMGKRSTPEKLPSIFQVNWFRKGVDGTFLWPGFSHNVYVLKWIFERLSGSADIISSPIGNLPKKEAQFPQELIEIDRQAYLKEMDELGIYFSLFGTKFPAPLHKERERIIQALTCKT